MKRTKLVVAAAGLLLVGLSAWGLSRPVRVEPLLRAELAFLRARDSQYKLIETTHSFSAYMSSSLREVSYPTLRFEFTVEPSFESKLLLPALRSNRWDVTLTPKRVFATKAVAPGKIVQLDVRGSEVLTVIYFDERVTSTTWWDHVKARIQQP